MKFRHSWLAAAALAAFSIGAVAEDLTKEQITEKALQAHPGQVEKIYKEQMKGQEVWEVKIKGDDGKKWEVYYSLSGELVKTKSE
jgi:uncharacterized membrane protein YkoI